MTERINLDRVARARGDQTVFMQDPVQETLLTMVVSLLGEVCVLRDRLDSHERLLAKEGFKLAPADVAAFVPDEPAAAERAVQRDRAIERVLRPIRERLLPDELRLQNEGYRHILSDVQRDPSATLAMHREVL